MKNELATLKLQVKKLKECIDFYKNPKNYKARKTQFQDTSIWRGTGYITSYKFDKPLVAEDGGEKAREVLRKL